MTWEPYKLDQSALSLVIKYRDNNDVLKESHKMRVTVSYGLERFWGEHLRLLSKGKAEDRNKGLYWKDTWEQLVKILAKSGLILPNDKVDGSDTQQIQQMAQKLWNLSLEDQRIALAVLTQLCDSLVWWTQRCKKKDVKKIKEEEDEG